MKRKILPSAFATTIIILFIGFIFSTCKKDKLDINNPPDNGGSFLSTQDFLNHHAVASEFFTFDNANGGTFVSVKGSQIIVSPNSFTNNGGTIITGNVTMEFKDIYHKSDMILSQMPTTLLNGGILESGGMFSINVTQGGQILFLAPGKNITVSLPIDSGAVADSSMTPFVFVQDTTGGGGWVSSSGDSIYSNPYYYTYLLYNLYPGSWYNCDSPGPFAGFSTTLLTVHQNDSPSLYGTQVFLVFPGYNAMINLYAYNANDFLYYNAPIGVNCTMLAIGVKDSNLYYSKQDFIIAPSSAVNFSMTQTTETDLLTLLNTLNN